MEFLSFSSIPPLICSALFLFIGISVYKNSEKASLNNAFFALCVSTFIWQFVMFLLFNTKDPFLAKIFVKLAHVGIVFLHVFVFHFVINFIDKKSKVDKWILWINYTASFLFVLLLFTDLFINGYYDYFWSFYPKAGVLHPLYLFMIVVTFIKIQLIFFKFFKNEKKSADISYHQKKYIFGAIIFYSFASVDFLLNYGMEFYPIGFIFILIFMAITAYTIVKHRFMDIKIVLRQSSVYALTFFVTIVLAILLSYYNNPDSEYFNLLNSFIVVCLVILFPYIKKYFIKIANKYFFTSLYDNKNVISDLSNKLRTTLELDYIYEYIFDTIDSAFHSESFGFLTFDSQQCLYEFKYKKGLFSNTTDSFKGDIKLHQFYTKKNRVIIINELRSSNDVSYIKIADHFSALGIEMLIPLNIKWRNIGLLALGKKETKEIYTTNDIDLLEIIANFGASAIENGYLFKNIIEKNKKLENLLSVKNDFLMIANHQLNTPLSIMRLAYSSVEEKIIPIEKGFFMAKEGLDRICNVIFQLWIVFDLESGRLNLRDEKVDLFKMFQELIIEKNITDQVVKKKLKITLSLLTQADNCFVKVDSQKIRNVISGILDNAIFYTNQGIVTIKLSLKKIKNKSFLKTTIIDTGIGIPKEEQDLIFEKFSRGKNARFIHPDGSGVGLYVAKYIVEASGGVFLLEKTGIGKGSVFSFTLPIYRD